MAIGEGLNLRHREAIYLDLAQPWVRRTASFRARGGRLPAKGGRCGPVPS